MARQFVTLALVLFAIVGLAAAQEPSVSPVAAPSNAVIGNTDSDPSFGDDVEAGPVGAPVPDGVFVESPDDGVPEDAHKSDSAVVKVSVTVGVSVAAVAAVFF